jgi:NADH-ubiquinone oxidoreductase chain 5
LSGHGLTFKALDRGLIENMGPHGRSKAIVPRSKDMVSVQTGYVFHYVFSMVLGATLFVMLIGLGDTLPILDLRVLALFVGLISLGG